jgi:hypothetical protein
MANGKHTADCRECKHHYFHRDPPDSFEGEMMCALWKTSLHRRRYGTLNMFCTDYEPPSPSAPSFGSLSPHMDRGILYAIFYNDLSDPTKLTRVLDLATRRFVDGHPDDWRQ